MPKALTAAALPLFLAACAAAPGPNVTMRAGPTNPPPAIANPETGTVF